MKENQPIRIVIVGGGFGGISTGMELERLTKRDRSIEVHLVNSENFFVFQPLIPEVVSCSVEPTHILNPIRQLFRRVHFYRAIVKDVDRDRQAVTIVGSDERRLQTLHYDHLVWCLGQVMDLSKVPGMAEHSLPIKTLGDAFHLRNHVLSRLEEADLESDQARRRKALTFVAVGGGFSGVETVAEINDMIKSVLPFYPRAHQTGCRMVLVHSAARILGELDERLAGFAQRKVMQRGVEVILNTKVTEVTAEGIVLSNGQHIPADTVICTVGSAAHPLVLQSRLPHERGRIVVDEYLRVKGSQNVWAIGDAALIPDVRRGGFCPPMAQYAIREGTQCARNVAAAIRNQPLRPFQFGGLGQLAVVGRRCGVARIWGFQFAGMIAWLLWRCVYLAKVPGLRCKLRVGLDWALDAVFFRDITMIELRRTEQLKRAHFRPGEVIVKQGEIGDHFYIIESGEVEIVREEPGKPDHRMGTRAAGGSFGEIALLKSVPRTATVRCLTPVDVLKISRQDFLNIVHHHTVIRALMEREARALLENDPCSQRGG